MSTAQPSPASSCIKILPDSHDDLVIFEYDGYITEKDYKTVLWSLLSETIKKHGALRLVCRFTENYDGWEEGAAQANMQNIMEHVGFVKKIAYVNPPSSKVFQTKLLGSKLFNGEIKYYNLDQFDQAEKWANE